jgi:hypothetical protein
VIELGFNGSVGKDQLVCSAVSSGSRRTCQVRLRRGRPLAGSQRIEDEIAQRQPLDPIRLISGYVVDGKLPHLVGRLSHETQRRAVL